MSNPKGPGRTGRTGRWPIPAATQERKKPSQSKGERPAGRIVHDERGNAVWNWGGDTTRTRVGTTSAMLKRLEVPDLTIEGQEEAPTPGSTSAPSKGKPANAGASDAGGGYNPYDKHKVSRKPAPAKSPTGKRAR